MLKAQNLSPHLYINNAYDLFHKGTLALAQMERNGVRIDVDYIKRAKEKITFKIEVLEKKFKKSVFYKDWEVSRKGKSINIYSGHQLSEYLYKVRNVEMEKKTKTGQGSTDEEALMQLNIPELETYIQIKKLQKIRDTYLAAYEREQVEGQLHPFFNLNHVTTFRSSSTNPNQQNVPVRDEEAKQIVRKAILPRKGHQFLELDYGQLEVRIGCCYHNDPTMIKYIKDKTTDMHRDMAQQIFKLKKYKENDKSHRVIRAATKNGFVFPQFYGDYYKPCADNIAVGWCGLHRHDLWKRGQGIMFEDGTISEHMIKHGFVDLDSFAKHLQKIEKYFWNKRFPIYNQWREDMWQFYLKHGYVESFTGFTYKNVMRRNEVINYPVQGAAFHVTLLAIILATDAQNRDHWKSRLVGETHDSILLDVHPSELDEIINIMKCIMEHDTAEMWKWITVPLEIDAELAPVDAPLSEKKPYKIN